MTTYILRRLLQAIPTVLGISIMIFVLMRIVPGDPASIILDPKTPPEAREAFRRAYGLDRPIYVQYWIFFKNAVQGDLGRSFRSGTSVTSEVLAAAPGTIELTLTATIISVILGVVAGIFAAVDKNSAVDYTSMVTATIGMSMPVYWLGLLLIMLFAVKLRLLPVAGRIDSRLYFTPESGFLILDALRQADWTAFRSVLGHLVLPSVTLGFAGSALIARMTRTAMLEVMMEDFITTAKGKGLQHSVVVMRHALKNALLPVITVVGTQVGYLLGGAVLTETVFNWPGLGSLLVSAIFSRDYPIVQGTVLFICVTFVVVNLLVDTTYAIVDPRVRYQ